MDRGLATCSRVATTIGLLVAVGCGSPSEVAPAKCQSASIGMAECIEDADCQSNLDAWVEGMEGPRVPRERTIVGTYCIPLTISGTGADSGSGPACDCELEGGGSLYVGPQGIECLARSRTGQCIWGGAAFPGCDASGSNCPDLCEQLLEKHREDDLRVFEAEALGAVCERFSCKSLARVEDQCFFNLRNVSPAPCDAELLSMSEPPDPGAEAQCPPPAREFHPRPEDEWQGMRVRVGNQPICAGKSSCSFALACRDGLCGPCLADEDCAGGEVCVLDHCLIGENVTCRSYSDCDEGSLCVLSGYSAGYRGNGDMRAQCLSPSGGAGQ